MVPGEHHPSPRDHQHLGHEQSELPVAEDDGAHPGRDHHLLQHLERGGQRLDEDRRLVGDPVRHVVQVASREHQLVCERAFGADDTATVGAANAGSFTINGVTFTVAATDTVAQVRDEIKPMGFKFQKVLEFLPWQHIIIFTREDNRR